MAAALSAAMVFAQGPGPRAGSGAPPDPTTMIQMRVNNLATLLGLSDAQKMQALTIFTNAYNASQTAMTMLKTDRDSLENAIKTNNTATIDQLSATIGGLQGQLLGINAKANSAFYAILTPDQQTKYDALPHGPGGGPGPGFGPRFHGGPPPQ
jgi:Spy/CpxP family protein refolding chaperone